MRAVVRPIPCWRLERGREARPSEPIRQQAEVLVDGANLMLGLDQGHALAVDELRPLDLLAQIRTALDGLQEEIRDRIVNIEMPRLQVQADPEVLRRALASAVAEVARRSPPGRSITISAARLDRGGRRGSPSTPQPMVQVEVVEEGSDASAVQEMDDPRARGLREDVRAMGGESGVQPQPGGNSTLWFTVPLPAGASAAPDA